MLRLSQRDHLLEHVAMLRQEEILGLQRLNGGVQRVVVQQDGAENRPFGFEVIRERTFESGIGRHKAKRVFDAFAFSSLE